MGQQQLFKDYYKLYGKFHFVYSLYKPQKWKLYPDEVDTRDSDETIINHREIFPCEVVFDIDLKDCDALKMHYTFLSNKLKKYKISFKAHNSGGKCNKSGIPNHIHVIFPELTTLDANHRPMYKEEIMNFFLGVHKDTSKCDYQLVHRHLVRAEYGWHEFKLQHKSLIESYEPFIKGKNKIPKKILDNIEKRLIKESERSNQDVTTPVESFPCITYLLSQDFGSLREGRKRALMLLCNFFYRNAGDKGLDNVLKWNDYKLNRYFGEVKVRKTFYNISKMIKDGRSFGCTSSKRLLVELGKKRICEGCVLNKKEDRK